MKSILILILPILTFVYIGPSSIVAYAQERQAKTVTIDPTLDQRGDDYMNRQSEVFLDQIKQTLKEHPPQYPAPKERNLSLLLLDAVMHDVYAAHRPPVQEFYKSRIEKTLEEIRNSKVKKGAMIWKLYNMSFIVRTKSVTLAFDLTSGESAGSDGFTLADATMSAIIDECDVLFISHRHRDHADSAIARVFMKQGKPVVAPPQVWKGRGIHNSINHLKREAHILQKLSVQHGKNELHVVVYPGNQMRSHENNVPLVITPEGLSICHMGDQINEGDFIEDYEWIDKVKDHYRVDVLFPPSWTNEIYRIVQGFDPALVIPGHENELGHTVDDRVPFWGDAEYLELTYPELKQSNYPLILMIWGESYHYLRKN